MEGQKVTFAFQTPTPQLPGLRWLYLPDGSSLVL